MSVAIDTLEHMFEHGGVSIASSTLAAVAGDDDAFSAPAVGAGSGPASGSGPGSDPGSGPRSGSGEQARVQELQARIRSMQASKLDSRSIPTHPAIAELLPGGALQQGAAYSVDRSAMLLMTLLAAPSAAGTWCAVVGVPEFGVEAAQHFGVDLDRLVLVPHPGDQWLAVTAAIADVVGVVVTRPPKRATDSNVARLSARLRQRGTTMLVLGSWPQTEAMLSLSHSEWHGIGSGHGNLQARQVTVTVTNRMTGRPRSARLWLPDAGETVRRIGADRPRIVDQTATFSREAATG